MSQIQQEELLKINLRCDHCGTVWQFENGDSVAEKSIDHHYKSGECQQNYERKHRPIGTYMNPNYTQTTTGTSTTFTWPSWGSPARGNWTTYF